MLYLMRFTDVMVKMVPLQGALEMAEIPYTGSGIMAHSVGMNKK